MNTDAILARLEKHGHPNLVKSSRGWWCFIEVLVPVVGVNLSIKSESNHRTPLAAAEQCEARLELALGSIARGTPPPSPNLPTVKAHALSP